MDAIKAIISRCSIRKYSDKKISPKIVRKLIYAAMCAPSASNEQPWHYVIIDDREILDDIPRIHPHARMLKSAPLAVCVCGDIKLERVPGLDYWILDCAAATENFLIAAHALNLGACWIGIHPRKDRKEYIQNVLHLPEGVIPFAIISLGYPIDSKQPFRRFKHDRIHKNSW